MPSKLMQPPIAFLPAGPVGWPTHQPIFENLEAAWTGLDWSVRRLWYPEPSIEKTFCREIQGIHSAVIIPLGIAHYDSLWTLKRLRDLGFQRPATIMVNSDFLKGLAPLLMYRSVLRSGDMFVVSCESEAAILRSIIKSENPIAVIPYPVDTDHFQPSLEARKTWERDLDVQRREIWFLYAGRLTPQKNLLALLEGFKIYLSKSKKPARLLIAGSPDDIEFPHFSEGEYGERYLHSFAKQVVKQKLESVVNSLGHLGGEKFRSLLQAVDTVVSVSTHTGEDFGYSIAQGLSSGASVVTTAWGGGHEFPGIKVPVKLSSGGPSVDVGEIAAALGAKRLKRQEARDWALSHVSRKAVALRWKEEMQKLRSSKRKPFELHPEGARRLFHFLSDKMEIRRSALFKNSQDPLFRDLSVFFSSPKSIPAP